jgi:flagellar basal-body rod modification protein FlgD
MGDLSVSSAGSLQFDYMNLLITQLQNQNPLEPMSSTDMAAQLAQFTQLSQLETMNSSFSEVLNTTRHEYASSLIGKTVSYQNDKSQTVSNTVSGVVNNNDGQVQLVVGSGTIGLDDVLTVQ